MDFMQLDIFLDFFLVDFVEILWKSSYLIVFDFDQVFQLSFNLVQSHVIWLPRIKLLLKVLILLFS